MAMYKVDLLMLLSRKRWVLVPLLGLILLLVSIVDNRMIFGPLGQPFNQWDILLGIFNNKFAVALAMPTIFGFIISDLFWPANRAFGQFFLIRCGSYSRWMRGRWAILVVADAVFLSGLFFTDWVGSLWIRPPSIHWSTGDYAVHFHTPFGFHASVLSMPPVVTMAWLWGLIFVGLLALGGLVMVVAFVTRMPLLGFASGIGVAASSLALPTAIKWLPTMQMILNFHRTWSPYRSSLQPSLCWSVGYFLLLSGITGGILLGLVRFRDV